MNRLKKIAISILSLLILVVGAFVLWATAVPAPLPQAIEALESTSRAEFREENGWLVYSPVGKSSASGLIIYPGGRVDARAYAPFAQAIAEAGYTAVIVPMPLNLAVFAPARAQNIIIAFPEIEHWAIAGHSLGGAMAANFADANPDLVDGVAFWASYPAQGDALDDQEIAVVSIYGTRDGLATVEDIEGSRPLLPEDTVWVPIEGGNHAQFGWYGSQSGDNPATVSPLAQQDATVAATIALLDKISMD